MHIALVEPDNIAHLGNMCLCCSKMQYVAVCWCVRDNIRPQYAFVLHTVNPTTSDASEMYGEIVVGQGEALVANAPGRIVCGVTHFYACQDTAKL